MMLAMSPQSMTPGHRNRAVRRAVGPLSTDTYATMRTRSRAAATIARPMPSRMPMINSRG